MTTVRYITTSQQKTAEDGRGLCKVCEKPVPKRRRSYCSDECSLRNTPSMIRAAVFERDKGICAICKADCESRRLLDKKLSWERRSVCEKDLMMMFYHARENMLKSTPNEPYEWQADHIIPVAEGGGLCGLDGYRTLCSRCHGKVTGELRKRLNAKHPN